MLMKGATLEYVLMIEAMFYCLFWWLIVPLAKGQLLSPTLKGLIIIHLPFPYLPSFNPQILKRQLGFMAIKAVISNEYLLRKLKISFFIGKHRVDREQKLSYW